MRKLAIVLGVGIILFLALGDGNAQGPPTSQGQGPMGMPAEPQGQDRGPIQTPPWGDPGKGWHVPPRPKPWSPDAPMKGFLLAPEQQAKLTEIRRRFNEETASLREALLTKRFELQYLWTNPQATPNGILEKEREMRDLQNEMGEKILQVKLGIRKLLTSEQISQFGPQLGLGPVFSRGPVIDHGMRMGHRPPDLWR